MANPTSTPPNRLSPDSNANARRARSMEKGDVPSNLLDRYLVERDKQGRAERFYRDHRAREPMFRDRGRSLVSSQAYPDAVTDMLRVAQHRGWSAVRVSGDEAFRREVWVQAQALGLDVKGHRPTERDRAAAPPGRDPATPPRSRRLEPENGSHASTQTLEGRLKMAIQVVRVAVADPEMQARLIARAWARASPYLEIARRSSDDRANPTPQRSLDR